MAELADTLQTGLQYTHTAVDTAHVGAQTLVEKQAITVGERTGNLLKTGAEISPYIAAGVTLAVTEVDNLKAAQELSHLSKGQLQQKDIAVLEKVQVHVENGIKHAMQGTGMIVGGIAGAAGGSAVGPVGTFAGAVGGGVAGQKAGQEVAEHMIDSSKAPFERLEQERLQHEAKKAKLDAWAKSPEGLAIRDHYNNVVAGKKDAPATSAGGPNPPTEPAKVQASTADDQGKKKLQRS